MVWIWGCGVDIGLLGSHRRLSRGDGGSFRAMIRAKSSALLLETGFLSYVAGSVFTGARKGIFGF